MLTPPPTSATTTTTAAAAATTREKMEHNRCGCRQEAGTDRPLPEE